MVINFEVVGFVVEIQRSSGVVVEVPEPLTRSCATVAADSCVEGGSLLVATGSGEVPGDRDDLNMFRGRCFAVREGLLFVVILKGSTVCLPPWLVEGVFLSEVYFNRSLSCMLIPFLVYSRKRKCFDW